MIRALENSSMRRGEWKSCFYCERLRKMLLEQNPGGGEKGNQKVSGGRESLAEGTANTKGLRTRRKFLGLEGMGHREQIGGKAR